MISLCVEIYKFIMSIIKLETRMVYKINSDVNTKCKIVQISSKTCRKYLCDLVDICAQLMVPTAILHDSVCSANCNIT